MKQKITARLKSKTYWAAMIALLLTAIEMQNGVIFGWVSAEYRPYLVFVWPMLMLTMREMTNAALSDK